MPWNKYRFKKKEPPKAPLSKEEEEKKKHEPKRVQELAGGGIASGIRRFDRGGKV